MLTKQALHFPSIPCTTNFTVPTSIWAVCLYITCCPFNTFTLAASFHFCLYWFNLLIACCIGFHSVFFLCPCVYVHVSTYCVCMWSFRCFSTLGFETGTPWGLLISLSPLNSLTLQLTSWLDRLISKPQGLPGAGVPLGTTTPRFYLGDGIKLRSSYLHTSPSVTEPSP